MDSIAFNRVRIGPFCLTAPRPTIAFPNPASGTIRASKGGELHSLSTT